MIAFVFRYVAMIFKIFIIEDKTGTLNQNILTFALEFMMVMPVFYLFMSLIWKKFEKRRQQTDLFHKIFQKSNLIYVCALLITSIDFILGNFILMYITQILIFSTTSIITYRNYRRSKKTISQMFFLSMLMFLFVGIINFIAQYTIDFIPELRIYAYLVTAATSFLLFYIVDKLSTQSQDNKTTVER